MQTTSIILLLAGTIFQFFGVTLQLVDHHRNQPKTVLNSAELFRESRPPILTIDVTDSIKEIAPDSEN